MPVQFERTNNLELVAAIMRHPRLYPSLTNDFACPAEDFGPNPDPAIYYLLVTDGPTILGLYITHPILNSPFMWEIHLAILPTAWARTHEIGEAFERWIFTNTPCQTGVGFIPACNKLALRYARRHMTETGILPACYPKNGKLHDLHVFHKHKAAFLSS